MTDKEKQIYALRARVNKLEHNPINFKSSGVLNKLRRKLKKLESENKY